MPFKIPMYSFNDGSTVKLSPGNDNIIHDALSAATANTTFILEPGDYHEKQQLVISQPGIILCCQADNPVDGRHSCRILVPSEFDGDAFCSMCERDCKLLNISIKVEAAENKDQSKALVSIEKDCNAEILGCLLSCGSNIGLDISGNSKPSIEECVVEEARW
eukprot:754890-Hanusia_phi.AAC.9